MESKQYKLGIIGSRIVDDVNFNSESRQTTQKAILEVINSISGKQEVVGFTGLNLGTEQDFGLVCKNHGLKIVLVIPFPNLLHGWKNLSESVNLYKEIQKNSISGITLSEIPNYSPKKQIKRNNYIIENSDGVIFIRNQFNPMDSYISYANDLKKDVYFINVP